MSASRPHCLMILSSAVEGVTAQSFIQAFNLASSNFSIQLASPGGRNVEYTQQDESNRRWFNEFRSKSTSSPIALDTVDAARYTALLIPSAPGALHDLANNKDLGQILSHFVTEKKAICAVGMGVAGLCAGKLEGEKGWCFENYSLTSPSVNELGRSPDFGTLPIILEDFIKINGGRYNCSEADAVHVIIDRHVITGQNTQSTLTAVQNLTLMCAPKHKVMSPR